MSVVMDRAVSRRQYDTIRRPPKEPPAAKPVAESRPPEKFWKGLTALEVARQESIELNDTPELAKARAELYCMLEESEEGFRNGDRALDEVL
jgi:hypothetical protein